MKTQIIQLEPHDDPISIKDKMDWSQSPRILLIVPEGERILTSRLDVVLLERHSAALGSQLALVTRDTALQFNAEQLGIPVFTSRQTAQISAWRKSRRAFRRKDLMNTAAAPRELDFSQRPAADNALLELPLWSRLVVFTIGVLSVFSVAGLLLPRAEIILPAADTVQSLNLPVRADSSINRVHVSGLIPAQELSTQITHQESIVTTGWTDIPDQTATGVIEFTNLTDSPLTVPQNTILSSGGENPISFRTRFPVLVPGERGATAAVEMESVEPGSQNNLPADSISEIFADFGPDLLVSNPEPTRGGSDLRIPAPTKQDRERLHDLVTGQLEEKALVQLKEAAGEEDFLLCNSPRLKETIQQEYSPENGMPGTTLNLIIQAEYSCFIVRDEDLRKFAEEFLRSRYRGSHLQPIDDTITITKTGSPVMLGRTSTPWEIRVSYSEKAQLDGRELARHVLGLSPEQAQSKAQQVFNLPAEPEIHLTPSWWFRLPAVPFRIEVK